MTAVPTSAAATISVVDFCIAILFTENIACRKC
jgi:hypothetical protein